MNLGATPEAAVGRRGVSGQGCVLYQSKGRRILLGGPSLPLLGFVEGSHFGSGTNFLFPFQLVCPLPQTEKILPGLPGRLGMSGRTSNSPVPDASLPAFSYGRARGTLSGDACITPPLPSSSLLPHTIPVLDFPNTLLNLGRVGPRARHFSGPAGCSSSTLAPRTTPPTVLISCCIPHWRGGRS